MTRITINPLPAVSSSDNSTSSFAEVKKTRPSKPISGIAGNIIATNGTTIAAVSTNRCLATARTGKIKLYDLKSSAISELAGVFNPSNQPYITKGLKYQCNLLMASYNNFCKTSQSTVILWDPTNTKTPSAQYNQEGKISAFDFTSDILVCGFDHRNFQSGTDIPDILQVVDIQSKKTVTTLRTSDFCIIDGIAIRGSLILHTFEDQLHIRDIRIPDAPQKTINFDHGVATSCPIWLDEYRVVYGAGPRLELVDLRKTESSTLLSTHLGTIRSVTTSGELIFSNASQDPNVHVYDLTSNNPSTFSYLDSPPSYSYFPSNLVIQDNNIYASDHQISSAERINSYSIKNEDHIVEDCHR